MNQEKDARIAVKKTLPKFLAIIEIMECRAEQYKSMKPVLAEIRARVPKELTDVVNDIVEDLTKNISPAQEDKMDERFDTYLNKLGPDSFEVAEAAADPSLERVNGLVRDINQIFSRYAGKNPLPVLKNKISFYVINPSGNLSDDEKFDDRVADVEHVLKKKGKSLDDISSMPLDEVLKIRKQVQNRGIRKETREFYEDKVAEKYGEYMLKISEEFTSEKVLSFKLDKLASIIQENLLDTVPDDERDEVRAMLQEGALTDIAVAQSKILILRAAQQFISCSINTDYIRAVKKLAKIGGIDIEIDGKVHNVSALDYVSMGKREMNAMKRLKDYLVDIAMEKGSDAAITEDTINAGIRFAYDEDRAEYVNHLRFKQRAESSILKSLFQGKKISIKELKADSTYAHTISMIDQQAKEIAKQVFGE
jgi:hypothetical protein